MRPARLAVPLPCLLLAFSAGCRSSAPVTSSLKGEAGIAAPVIADSVPLWTTPAVFSAPIGAARVARVDVVAGLVAAEGVVRAVGFAGGAVAWTADAIHGVAWAPDAEIRLQPAGDGVAVFWRGLRDGKPVRTLVLLGPRGEPRGAPVETGAPFCGTRDGLAWIAPHTTGATRVRARRPTDTEARDLAIVSPDRDLTLVCGDHDVTVLGDGDDDLTATVFAPGDTQARSATVLMRNTDFGDDEREHDAYSVGDDLGLVRIGGSGAVALREMPHGSPPGAWRKLKNALSADDDVVGVDGDSSATFIILTRDADETCDGGATAENVRALRVDRNTGLESLIDLVPGDCSHARGPFWIASAPSGAMVAWIERRTLLSPRSAQIAGFAYRALRAADAVVGRVEQEADALVEAGCDEGGCSAAALVREPGSDGMRPASIRVLEYH